jgi:hypothetical protein
MPARDDASNEEICDLDAIVSKTISFRLAGRDRFLKEVTTGVLFEYVDAINQYVQLKHETVDESNAAYFAIIKTVCDDITLEETAKLSIIQKANLAEHLARKISGRRPVDDELKKKVTTTPTPTI